MTNETLIEVSSELTAALATIEKCREIVNCSSEVSLQDHLRQLAAENVGLKAGASYFSYGSEHNFEWHKTAKEAVEEAEAAIDDYRGDACDGWSEEVDSICWGIIMQSSTKVGERPRNEDDRCDPAIDTVCDYALLPNIETPATDRIVAEAEMRGLEKAREIVCACYNNICPGGLAENRQYEEAIVQPHLDVISDELDFEIEKLREEVK